MSLRRYTLPNFFPPRKPDAEMRQLARRERRRRRRPLSADSRRPRGAATTRRTAPRARRTGRPSASRGTVASVASVSRAVSWSSKLIARAGVLEHELRRGRRARSPGRAAAGSSPRRDTPALARTSTAVVVIMIIATSFSRIGSRRSRPALTSRLRARDVARDAQQLRADRQAGAAAALSLFTSNLTRLSSSDEVDVGAAVPRRARFPDDEHRQSLDGGEPALDAVALPAGR